MLAIGHFSLGIAGMLTILLYYPQIIPNYIKYDLFLVLASGFWAMIPDIKMVISTTNSQLLHELWANIFWFHPWVDSWTKDDPRTAAIFIAIAGILTYIYFKKVNGL